MDSLTRQGDIVYAGMDKINSELFSMTYGAIVMQLIKDYKDVAVVNVELEKMGYNIGVRLVEEFLAKSGTQSCSNFRDTGMVIARVSLSFVFLRVDPYPHFAKVAFKMFLGITAEAVKWRDDGKEFSLVFKNNPLHDFVQLPAQYANLQYSNILCGVLRGALNMVKLVVDCEYVKSELTGATESEIRITLKELLHEVYKDDEE